MTNHTDTSRSGDLVKRLREDDYNWHNGACLEAADRLEALEAENERLRGALSNLINAYTANVDTYRLGGFYTDPETEDEVIEARAALGEKQ